MWVIRIVWSGSVEWQNFSQNATFLHVSHVRRYFKFLIPSVTWSIWREAVQETIRLYSLNLLSLWLGVKWAISVSLHAMNNACVWSGSVAWQNYSQNATFLHISHVRRYFLKFLNPSVTWSIWREVVQKIIRLYGLNLLSLGVKWAISVSLHAMNNACVWIASLALRLHRLHTGLRFGRVW